MYLAKDYVIMHPRKPRGIGRGQISQGLMGLHNIHYASGSTGVMAQWLECLPHNRKVVGSSPSRVIPKTLKMVLTAFSSGAR